MEPLMKSVVKWLSKVITWLRLLRLVIGLKDSRQFFNQWEAKPKSIAPCTHDFSRASSELQVIARNCDWFIALFLFLLSLVGVIALVLVFRQSFENRSKPMSSCSILLSFCNCLYWLRLLVGWHIYSNPFQPLNSSSVPNCTRYFFLLAHCFLFFCGLNTSCCRSRSFCIGAACLATKGFIQKVKFVLLVAGNHPSV